MSDLPVNLDAVAEIIRAVAAQEILPRFRNLKPHEVREKAANDPVTDADIGAERELTARLPGLLPGSVIVGEEGVSADPDLIARLDADAPVWIVDPVDGTSNFKNGSETFCSMVALVRRGETLAAWIYRPVADQMAMAAKGQGARLDASPLKGSPTTLPEHMRASIHLNYMPRPVARETRPRIARFAGNEELYCAGETYMRLAEGRLDVGLFWRTKPWDHAMGALILAEAGGRTAFGDGTGYSAVIRDRTGLLATANGAVWPSVRDILMPQGT